jgi:hypothetical protein
MTDTCEFDRNDECNLDYKMIDRDIVVEGSDVSIYMDAVTLNNTSSFVGVSGCEVAIHRYGHHFEYLYDRVIIETEDVSNTIAFPVRVRMVGSNSNNEVCRV